MTFNTTPLVGERVLVKGTDIAGTSGSTVLDGSQWAELNAHKALNKATEAYDDAVEEFFAPLVEAAEQMKQAIAKPTDSIGFVVLDEGTEGETFRPRQVVELTRDSVILRIIESGDTTRLVWVDGDLEVTAAPQQATTGSAYAASSEASGWPEGQLEG